MALDAAIADGLLSCRRMGSRTIAFALAAVAVSLGVAAWITHSDLFALASAALQENTDRISSFEDRFFQRQRLHRLPAVLPSGRWIVPPWLCWK
jgi:hypothetical protein